MDRSEVDSAGSPDGLCYGSPDKPGPYIFRVGFPAGYKLPPHHHQDARAVTVLQGNYWSAVGDTFDQSKLRKFGPRDYYTTDAGVNHFAWAETEVIIQEMRNGPGALAHRVRRPRGRSSQVTIYGKRSPQRRRGSQSVRTIARSQSPVASPSARRGIDSV